MRTFQVSDSYEGMSQAAAAWILSEARAKPQALISLPTGASPARMYEALAEATRGGRGDLSKARFLKLDEWGGLEMDDPATCEVHLQEKLLRPLRVGPKNYIGFLTNPPDPRAECSRIAEWLATNGPIDICILGIGLNGHLGLNEPAEALQAGPHVAELSESTKRHPMLAAARGEARYGLTLGMADLLRSRKVLLLASGAAKAEPLDRAFRGGISTRFPASFLQLHHDVTVICDRAARP
jgi:putative deaminase/isomerase